MWRWVNRAASLILALVVLATLGGGYLFYRAMPAYSGVETLPGLSAEVASGATTSACRTSSPPRWTTRRGRSATPRERAAVSDGDPAARRPGPDRRDPGRRASRRRQVHSHARLLSPGRVELRGAFAGRAGALASLCRRRQRVPRRATPLPPEFLIVGDKPEPWKPADTLVWGKLRPGSSATTTGSRSCAPSSSGSFGPEQASWLFPTAARGADHDAALARDGHAAPRRARTTSSALLPDSATARRTNGWSPDRARRRASRSSPTIRISNSARRSSGISRAS